MIDVLQLDEAQDLTEAAVRKWMEARGWTSMVRRWHGIHGGQAVGGVPSRGERYNSSHTQAVDNMLDVAQICGAKIPKFTLSDVLRCRGIVALGYLDEIRPPPAQRKSWHMPGCYGLHFSTILPLPEPIPCKGALGFWRVPEPARTMIQNSVL